MALSWRSTKILSVSYFQRQLVACLSSYEVRKRFIDFFKEEHGHQFVSSSPVTLHNDPSLLFVNAGMNQFKPKLLGTAEPNDSLALLKTAVNSQKCIRVGGKHNDLDDVGKDTSHHTFFEMLGSWSFGDYFKDKACQMALELLTKHFEIPIERLYFTYFAGDNHLRLSPDVVTKEIWKSLGIPEGRILPFGVKDNFWEMGDVGPCGPCTEIHYDYVGGKKSKAHLVNLDHPDVVEIWNIVFMQYNRLSESNLSLLPTNHVDTGMGLERIATVLQGKRSNYDTDLFVPIIKLIQKVCNCPVYTGGGSETDKAYRIVSDHVRMITIAIGDGIFPGNTGVELIVRQVLRRAYLSAKQHLNAPDIFLSILAEEAISILSLHYESLRAKKGDIIRTVREEEKRFCDMLQKGRTIFHRACLKLENLNFPVQTAILLHNHYGYPLNMLLDEIKEKNLHIDMDEFRRYQEDREMLKRVGREEAKKKSGQHKFQITTSLINDLNSHDIPFTESEAKYNVIRNTDGTYSFPTMQSTILAIISPSYVLERSVGAGEWCTLVMKSTCFYHEEGGQICDTGKLLLNQNEVFQVKDVSYGGGFVFHHGMTCGGISALNVGDEVELQINAARREACMRAHTATHLLNHALRDILGQVSQQGSKVGEDELRFTFAGKCPTKHEVVKISSAVRTQILDDHQVHSSFASLASVLQDSNVRRLTGNVYSDPSRIVSIGQSPLNDHSVELCGGTHVVCTSDVNDFEIILCKSQGAHKTTIRCLTSYLAKNSAQLLQELQEAVQEAMNTTNKVLLSKCATINDCSRMKSKVGKLNYQVNCADISIVCKTELKEKLRKHSQMLSTKMRTLTKEDKQSPTSNLGVNQ